jgi:hypothetical protein
LIVALCSSAEANLLRGNCITVDLEFNPCPDFSAVRAHQAITRVCALSCPVLTNPSRPLAAVSSEPLAVEKETAIQTSVRLSSVV